MNAKQIKENFNLTEFLQSIGVYPARKYKDYWLYHCPFRKDNKPSFSVNLQRNRWMDFTTGKNGDVIDLVKVLHNTDTPGAISILSGNSPVNTGPDFFSFTRQNSIPENGAVEKKPVTITHVQNIQNPALIAYLHERKIPVLLASKYLEECYYIIPDHQKQYFALGLKNDMGGWALRNRYVKTAISPASFTTIEGNERHEVNIFEGFFDFLSYLVFFGIESPDYDCLILNSTSHMRKTISLLEPYSHINIYLDNDGAGKAMADMIESLHYSATNQSRKLYPGHKDFNDFLMSG